MHRSIFVAFAITSLLFACALGDSCINQEDGYVFTASDGCNTCTCLAGNAVCTEAVCESNAEPHGVICIMNQKPVTAIPIVPFCNLEADPANTVAISAAAPVTVGCVSLDAVCTMQQKFAQSPDGKIYQFNSCVPDDFKPVNVRCQAINNACTSDQRVLVALPKASFCGTEGHIAPVPTAVGCIDTSEFCLDAVTFAHDITGDEYVFPTTCIPDTFIIAKDSCEVVSCTDGSHTLYATPFEAYCSDNQESVNQLQVAVGCTENLSCIEMVTFAQSPSGEKYVFSSGCLPEGFTVFDGVCDVSCTVSQVTVNATPFELTCTSSFIHPIPVGCIDTGLICPQAITYATNTNGRLFVFNNGCIPEGFTLSNIIPTCEETTGCPAQYRPSRAILASNFCSIGVQAESEIVGCIPSNILCASMPLYAVSPKGVLFYFPFGCVPLGFTIVPADCADIMAAESCPANDRVVFASPFHNFCAGGQNIPSIGVGCIENDAMCTQQITFAKNSKDDVFVFGSGCIPETFVRVEASCPGTCDVGFKPVTAIDAYGSCWGAAPGVSVAEAVVGCIEESVICTMVETFARERGTGVVSIFPNSCLPPNYEQVPSIADCDDLICFDVDCASVNRICEALPVECFTTPCPPIPYCVEPECAGKLPYEQFKNDCDASCNCDDSGKLICGECTKESTSHGDTTKSTVIVAAGSVGVAAASVAAFVGYRKYFHKDRAFSFRTKPTYATMKEEEVV